MTPALALAALFGAAAPGGSGESFAIVIGHNGGAEGLPPLRFADDDAAKFAHVFGNLFGPDNVFVLTRIDADTRADLERAGLPVPAARPPTRSALFAVFAELRRRIDARRPASLFVVYAGHGRQGRFLLEPEEGPEAALTGAELRAALAELPLATASVFLDACRSQSVFVERGDGPDLGAAIAALERRARVVPIGVLVAATSDRPAGELGSLRSGLFSHVLLSGLTGAADADGDDRISFGELAAFVAFNTVRVTGQRPWFDPPGGDLGAVVMDHRTRAGRLVFAGPVAGRLRVGASGGRPIFVEVNKAAGRRVSLALPPGRYEVARADGSGAQDVDLAPGAREVEAAAFMPRLAMAERGEPESTAFEAPFSSEIVATLAAGYKAGQEPTRIGTAWRHEVRAGYLVGPAPLALAGLEQGLEAGFRMSRGRLLFGLRVELRTSRHDAGGESYELRRAGLRAETGLRFAPTARVELGAIAGAGLRATYRIADGNTTGDPRAPVAGAGGYAALSLGDSFAVYVGAEAAATFIAVDGDRTARFEVQGGTGIAWRR